MEAEWLGAGAELKPALKLVQLCISSAYLPTMVLYEFLL